MLLWFCVLFLTVAAAFVRPDVAESGNDPIVHWCIGLRADTHTHTREERGGEKDVEVLGWCKKTRELYMFSVYIRQFAAVELQQQQQQQLSLRAKCFCEWLKQVADVLLRCIKAQMSKKERTPLVCLAVDRRRCH